MFNYANIVDGVVVGIQQSQKEIINTDLISVPTYDLSLLGKSYDGDIFIDSPELEVIRRITPDVMRDRFFFEERVAIKSSTNMEVQTFYDDLTFRRKPVNLDSPRFRLAMDLLLAEGLIKTGRDAVLLADGTQDEAA